MPKCWLVKTEPSTYSIERFEKEKTTLWDCVRNYQARNFLKEMTPGDKVLVYHSQSEPVGVVGVARVAARAEPDPTQFDPKSDYFDEAAMKDAPRWFAPRLKFVERFGGTVPLAALKKQKGLAKMELLKRGSRLSVQPVSPDEFDIVLGLAARLEVTDGGAGVTKRRLDVTKGPRMAKG